MLVVLVGGRSPLASAAQTESSKIGKGIPPSISQSGGENYRKSKYFANRLICGGKIM